MGCEPGSALGILHEVWAEEGAVLKRQPVWLLQGSALQVILDTGCRTAVAGAAWHRRFQQYLQEQGLARVEISHNEVFRFGAGEPVVSSRAFIYPVVLRESQKCSSLRVVEVANTTTDSRVEQCPALVGPSDNGSIGGAHELWIGTDGDRRTCQSCTA